jgi:hypothetical protein
LKVMIDTDFSPILFIRRTNRSYELVGSTTGIAFEALAEGVRFFV